VTVASRSAATPQSRHAGKAERRKVGKAGEAGEAGPDVTAEGAARWTITRGSIDVRG
jgi:hypothetical protein